MPFPISYSRRLTMSFRIERDKINNAIIDFFLWPGFLLIDWTRTSFPIQATYVIKSSHSYFSHVLFHDSLAVKQLSNILIARDGHLETHHDLQARPARPGKTTQLGVRGSIVPAAPRTSYSSFLKAGRRDLFSAMEKNGRRGIGVG